MTILNRLYASGGEDVILETLEINVDGNIHWLTRGWTDFTATLENGVQQPFTACGIEIALPARNADGTQDLNFAICNVDGVISKAVREAIEGGKNASLTYRCFRSSDRSAPAERPFTLAIKSGYWTAIEVQFTAGYMNVLDTAWPRARYTLPEYPGLRYIS